MNLLDDSDHSCPVCNGRCDGIANTKEPFSPRRALVQSAQQEAAERFGEEVEEAKPQPKPGKRARNLADNRARTLQNDRMKHLSEDRGNEHPER